MIFSRIAVIYNPQSGRLRRRRRKVARFAQLLRQEGAKVCVYRTERPHHATEFAHEAVAKGCDLIVAHGGDGTMNEVLQALVGTTVTLGLWPGGTANVLAHEIRFPRTPEAVVRRILIGRVQRVTVGKANDRFFLLMAGVGLDAAVVAGVNEGLKRRVGKSAFAVSALRRIVEWDLKPVRVLIPGEELEARFVVVGNAHSYGGGFRLTPQAELTDPHLHLCIFRSDRRFDYLCLAVAALFGWHLNRKGVDYRKVSGATIATIGERPSPYQVDGELAGLLPIHFEAIPLGVSLLM